MPLLTADQIYAEAPMRLAQRLLARRTASDGSPLWHAEVRARMRTLHPKQAAFVESSSKRKVVRAGRRAGKTLGVATYAVRQFLAGRRILYAVPTQEQVDQFWYEVKRVLEPAIDQGLVYKNETRHLVELPRTQVRIRAKTAFNADMLRGDYADDLILDEWQLCNEDAWSLVGAPMLLDNNGNATFVYSPPSFRTAGMSKAHDPRHAAKLFEVAQTEPRGRWAAFHFTSHDNPHLSTRALEDITQDMSPLAYKQEILAEDLDEVPGALWSLRTIDAHRRRVVPDLVRLVIGIDPGHDAGIVAAGIDAEGHAYVLEDLSVSGPPEAWADQSVAGYYKYHADALIPERNHGGEMVEATIRQVDRRVPVKTVWASRGKYARAEPTSTLYAKGLVHHVGTFGALEAEMCNWIPETGQPSPNRLDALVWALTELMLKQVKHAGAIRR